MSRFDPPPGPFSPGGTPIVGPPVGTTPYGTLPIPGSPADPERAGEGAQVPPYKPWPPV